MQAVLRVWGSLLGHLGCLFLLPSLFISMGGCIGLCLLCVLRRGEAALGHASTSLDLLKQVGSGWSSAV